MQARIQVYRRKRHKRENVVYGDMKLQDFLKVELLDFKKIGLHGLLESVHSEHT